MMLPMMIEVALYLEQDIAEIDMRQILSIVFPRHSGALKCANLV